MGLCACVCVEERGNYCLRGCKIEKKSIKGVRVTRSSYLCLCVSPPAVGG